MDEEQNQEQQKKIGLPEGIFVSLVLLTAYGVGVLIDLTGVGIIIEEIIGFIVGIAMEFYLFLRGARGTSQFITIAIGTVFDGATIGALPGKIITWFITWFLFNHPKVMQKVAPVVQAAGGLAGAKAGAIGGATGAAEKVAE